MRILHTSDWHLGHTLHGLPRDYEHARFLDWLVDTLVRERIDVLLVCGDIFDTANPGARAQHAYYEFLARAHTASPHLQVVIIAGNHDSAQRLQAPREILRTMQVHVVGEVRGPDGTLCLDRMVLPLRDRLGEVCGWCAAVPFLRPSDLDAPVQPPDPTELDPLIEGVRSLYHEVIAAARARCGPDQFLIALGHCYMVGTEVSRLSERKILGGNQHALPVHIFDAGDPEDASSGVDYVALGHLHKAQRVGKRDAVRYSGAPVALSMAEGRNKQQVCLVDLLAGRPAHVRSIPVPRVVDIVRLPRDGAAPIAEVLDRIDQLPASDEFPQAEQRPFLEVRVLLDQPIPDLRTVIESRLDGRAPRLVKISLDYPAERKALGDVTDHMVLEDLRPEQVFRSLYTSRHDDEVPEDLLAAFHELIDAVEQGADVPGAEEHGKADAGAGGPGGA